MRGGRRICEQRKKGICQLHLSSPKRRGADGAPACERREGKLRGAANTNFFALRGDEKKGVGKRGGFAK